MKTLFALLGILFGLWVVWMGVVVVLALLA